MSVVCAPETYPAVPTAATISASLRVVSAVCAPVEKLLFATKPSTSASDSCVFVSAVCTRSLICDSVIDIPKASTPPLSSVVSTVWAPIEKLLFATNASTAASSNWVSVSTV